MEKEAMQTGESGTTLTDFKTEEYPLSDVTQKVTLEQIKKAKAILANGLLDNEQSDLENPLAVQQKIETPKVDTPISAASIAKPREVSRKKQSDKPSKRDLSNAYMLQERCRHLCLSLYMREHSPIQSLGFTSSIQGEGKSVLALATARVLAHDSSDPVTLIECNWEHPTLHDYFNLPATPGLAEWVEGMCDEDEIRHHVDDNLIAIPAGDGSRNPVKLLKKIQQHNLLKTLAYPNGAIIVELPPIITNGYGSLAAGLTDAVLLVVRTEAVPANIVEEACSQLRNLPVEGIILNQGVSKIPRWLRQLL